MNFQFASHFQVYINYGKYQIAGQENLHRKYIVNQFVYIFLCEFLWSLKTSHFYILI